MDEFKLIFAIVAGICFVVYIIIDQYQRNHDRKTKRVENIEKEVTEYCAYEGYECKKEDGVLNIKRRGINFRIFLNGMEDVKSTSVWIQYATQLDEDLNKMHWSGQTIMVNILNDRHPSLNVSMNTEDHVLWVHYRADIHSQKEFAYHFNGAYNEMQSLMNDYSELLPKLQADFPVEKKQPNPIGFR